MTETVTLTIDGIQITVPKGTLLVEAAKTVGIDIPVFCYHPKLKPAGACRMCLVEIERVPRLQTACTTPVSEGMVVHTRSNAVDEARRSVLEFLLINHPLDCPVCDKGGECPLQDNTFVYGPGDSRYQEPKRRFPKPTPISEHILLDRERCIMCFRCVRFQDEIAMDPCLTVLDRGTFSEIGVAPGRSFDSIFSGNTIELCPVGALTSVHYRFKARPWDLESVPSVCNQCSVGCNMHIDVRDDRIVRIRSRENPHVDDGWLCDIGRFTYEYLNSPAHLRSPEMLVEGQMSSTSWGDVVERLADQLASIIQEHGGESVGVLAAPNLTNEELYMAQKFARALGTNNIDHRLDGYYPGELGLPEGTTASIEDLGRAATILIVGADPLVRQPVLDLWIKRAYRHGANLVFVGDRDTDLARLATCRLEVPEPTLGDSLLALTKALLETKEAVETAPSGWQEFFSILASSPWAVPETSTGQPREVFLEAARVLARGPVALLYPRSMLPKPGGQTLATGVLALAMASGALANHGSGVYPLPDQPNEQGAIDMGVCPNWLPGHAPLDSPVRTVLQEAWGFTPPPTVGLGGAAMIDASRKGDIRGLIVIGSDFFGDTLAPVGQLAGVKLLVSMSSFPARWDTNAHFRLPLRAFSEKSGTYTNLEGRVQRAEAALTPRGQSLDVVEVLSRLGIAMGLWRRPHDSSSVAEEIETLIPTYRGLRKALYPYGARRTMSGADWAETSKPPRIPPHWQKGS